MNIIDFSVIPNPSEEYNIFLRNKIVEFNARFLHEQASQFSILAKNRKNDIIGGATIWEHSDALYVDILWVEENYRKKKIGTQLLNKIIEQAGFKNIKKIFVDTYDFQAVDFYIKNGFFIIGRLNQYLLGHDRIYLRKDLDLNSFALQT